ncbi:hypothetical protein EA58_19120 [Photobacterium galatheae]|uniref:Uncharacterized protein n=2 Tax=Photobacterium galatheae TaxID=1654360 RepID=A0A066RLP7_9GAMM|nr:hypothetical protein EA58_19120 [Photobacterium galatheae]
MQQALSQYCELLIRDDVCEDSFRSVCFQPEVDINEALKDSLYQPLTKATLALKSIDAWQHRDHLANLLNSEDIFFLFACLNADLKEALYKAGDMIRLTSRKLNHPESMRLNETEVFGVVPLYQIGFTYPEYAYLLAGSLVADWDETFAAYALNLPALLVAHHGYSEHLMKAFCYCDNDIARGRMFSQCDLKGPNHNLIQVDFRQHVNLVDVFRKEPEMIALFLSQLAQRFQAQAYVFPAASEPCVFDLARQFALTIIHPDDQAIFNDMSEVESLDLPFLEHMSAEQLATEIKAVIPASLGSDALFTDTEVDDADDEADGDEADDDDEDDEDDFEIGRCVAAWQDFITGALPQGNALWRYVESGENASVLEQVEPCDILSLALAGKYRLHRQLVRFSIRQEELDHCLPVNFLLGLSSDWFMKGVVTADEVECNRHKCIRLLDVIYRLKNQAPFSDDMVFTVLGKIGLMPAEDFYSRYGCDWTSFFLGGFQEFKSDSGKLGSSFHFCHQLLEAHLEQAKSFLTQIIQDPKHQSAGMALLAGLYHIHDDLDKHHLLFSLSKTLLEQELGKGMLAHLRAWCTNEVALDHIECTLYGSDDEADLEHFEQPITETQEQAFVVLEDYLQVRNNVSREESVKALQTILEQIQDADEETFCHGYLERSNGAEFWLSAAHQLAKTQTKIGESSRRFLSLWIEIAPAQVANVIAEQFPVGADVAAIIHHLRALVGEEIGEIQETVILMTTLIQSEEEDAKPLLEKYGERYASEKQAPDQSQKIHSVVSYLTKEDKQKFFKMLVEQYPSLRWYEYFDTALMDEIRKQISEKIFLYLVEQEVELPDDEAAVLKPLEDEILAFFTGQTSLEEALDKLRLYQVESFQERFTEVDLSSLLWHTSPALREHVLTLCAALSDQALHDCYDPSQVSETGFAQLLCEAGMTLERLLAYFIEHDLYTAIRYLTEQHDLFSSIRGLSEHHKLKLLKSLSVLDGQMPLVERFSEDDAAQVRDLVSRIREGQYRNRIYGTLLDLVDEGIYFPENEQLELFQRENPDAKGVPNIADYLVLESKSRMVELAMGQIFGMKLAYRPEMDGLAYPDKIQVILKVSHPEDHGKPVLGVHQIKANTECFFGWYLATKQLCRPGRYDIEIMAENQQVLLRKTFHVVESVQARRTRLPELEAFLNNDDVLRETLPPMPMGKGEMTVVDPARENEAVVLPYLLGDAPVPVSVYREQDQVVGLAVGQLDSVKQWRHGCNASYLWLERYLKSQTVLVGDKATMDKVLAEPDQSWQQVSKDTPFRVYQSEDHSESALIAVHDKYQGHQIFFGFNQQEDVCCYFIMSRRLNWWDRLISWVFRKEGHRRFASRKQNATP